MRFRAVPAGSSERRSRVQRACPACSLLQPVVSAPPRSPQVHPGQSSLSRADCPVPSQGAGPHSPALRRVWAASSHTAPAAARLPRAFSEAVHARVCACVCSECMCVHMCAPSMTVRRLKHWPDFPWDRVRTCHLVTPFCHRLRVALVLSLLC